MFSLLAMNKHATLSNSAVACVQSAWCFCLWNEKCMLHVALHDLIVVSAIVAILCDPISIHVECGPACHGGEHSNIFIRIVLSYELYTDFCFIFALPAICLLLWHSGDVRMIKMMLKSNHRTAHL